MCAAGVAASLAGCTKMDTAATTAAPAATEAAAKEETKAEEKAEDTEENVRRMKHLENVEYADCGNKPIIFDPFSGFGGISLAAQELGFPVIAGDLNPVAVILTKAATEIPQRFMEKVPANPNANKLIYAQAEGLAEDVWYYGKWMQEQAQEKLKDLYPNDETGEVAAWIWARTVQCPNPACSCQMPMVSSLLIVRLDMKHGLNLLLKMERFILKYMKENVL